jgi:CheY-like chemotaxis protein
VLARLSVRQPDVIVVDVNGKTLGLIDAIRTGDGLANAVDPATPLIVLTARVDELHRIRLLDRGGDDVLAKPYSYPELRARPPRCFDAPASATPPGSCASATSGLTSPRGPLRCAGVGSSCLSKSTSCCERSRANPPEC